MNVQTNFDGHTITYFPSCFFFWSHSIFLCTFWTSQSKKMQDKIWMSDASHLLWLVQNFACKCFRWQVFRASSLYLIFLQTYAITEFEKSKSPLKQFKVKKLCPFDITKDRLIPKTASSLLSHYKLDAASGSRLFFLKFGARFLLWNFGKFSKNSQIWRLHNKFISHTCLFK